MKLAGHEYPAALDAAVAARVLRTDVVLDVGCGIRPQAFFRPRLHLCVEPFGQYADLLRRFHGTRGDLLVLRGRALDALALLPDRAVDSSFLVDVIEHLPKDEGWKVLAELERVTRRQLVVFTPLGFMPQHHAPGEKDRWGLDGAAFQEHLSGWLPEELGADWEVHACAGYHETTDPGRRHGAFWALRTRHEALPALRERPLILWERPTDDDAGLARWLAAHSPSSYSLATPPELMAALPVLRATEAAAGAVHPILTGAPGGAAGKLGALRRQTLTLARLLERGGHRAVWLWSTGRLHGLAARAAAALARVPVRTREELLAKTARGPQGA